MSLKPSPVPTDQECSVCGLSWSRHGSSPTAKTCIDLLRADVTAARLQLANRPYVQPLPYLPYVTQWVPRTYGPYQTSFAATNANVTIGTGANYTAPQSLGGGGGGMSIFPPSTT